MFRLAEPEDRLRPQLGVFVLVLGNRDEVIDTGLGVCLRQRKQQLVANFDVVDVGPQSDQHVNGSFVAALPQPKNGIAANFHRSIGPRNLEEKLVRFLGLDLGDAEQSLAAQLLVGIVQRDLAQHDQ